MTSKSVSVVIPFGEGLDLLDRQLRQLADQEYSAAFEILISCNVQVLTPQQLGILTPLGSNVRVVDATAAPGPSYARNVGWRSALGDYVLFCDADDEVDRRWISSMYSALEVSPLVGGRLRYGRINPPYLSSWHKQLQEKPSRKFGHLSFVPSCNLGVRKSVLRELAGFNPEFTHGEDIDFCWRAQYYGYQLGFTSDAIIDYRLRGDAVSLLKQYFRYGVSDAKLLRAHKIYGARRAVQDTIKDFAAVVYSIACAPLSKARRLKMAARLGNLAGRVYGSSTYRIWAI